MLLWSIIIYISFQVKVTISFDLSLLLLDDHFNWKDERGECIHLMQHQGLCDGSYAIAAASVLSDRFCIKGNKVKKLSPQYIISCNKYSDRCDGGNMFDAWKGIMDQGLVTEECMPFLGDNRNTPVCPTPLSCIVATESYEKYYIKGFDNIMKDKPKVMHEIHQNGPVQAEMDLFEDLLEFKGDSIYKYTYGNLIGKISVKIIGWSLKEETPYWYVMTPFGSKIGRRGGIMKIKFGECGIDDNFVFGMPK